MSGGSGDGTDAGAGSARARAVTLLQERARLLSLAPSAVESAVSRCTGRVPSARSKARLKSVITVQAAPPAPEPPAPGPPEQVPATAPLASAAIDPQRTQTDSVITQGPVTVGDTIPVGRIIAGYRIEGLLGKGGMGQVYRAVQLSVQREVAFKVLASRLAANQIFRERFLREARAAGRLHHYHLITVHDVGEADGLMFFSMEMVEGRTVRDALRSGPLAPELATDLALQTLRALAYAHENGLIHRDIKPDNLMVTPAGVVKIADLGLSRLSEDWDDVGSGGGEGTRAGTLMGTPHYMPPEQSRDAHAADERSDLYALGATFYHMLIGHPPFTGKSVVEVMMKAASEPLSFPDPPPAPELVRVLEKLLAKRPEDRYQNAKEAIVALEATRPGRGGAAHDGRRHRRFSLQWRKLLRLFTQPMSWILLAMVATILVVLAVLHRPQPQELDANERQDLAALIDQGHFRQALDRIAADSLSVAPESPAGQELAEDHDRAETQWNIESERLLQPAFESFDQAVANHHLPEAVQALHLADPSVLSPTAIASLEARQGVFEEQLAAMASGGSQSDPELLQAAKRDQQALTAVAFWQRLTARPSTAVAAIDLGESFRSDGSGFWRQRAAKAIHQELIWFSPGVEFGVRFAAPRKEAHWSLTCGEVLITFTTAGASMTIHGQPRQKVDAGDEVSVRLRRLDLDLQISLANGPWTDCGVTLKDGAPLRFNWSLGSDGVVQVLTHLMP